MNLEREKKKNLYIKIICWKDTFDLLLHDQLQDSFEKLHKRINSNKIIIVSIYIIPELDTSIPLKKNKQKGAKQVNFV